jgi:hypothetical protein
MGGGIPWAVTRQSRHQDICIDFLRFCTTVARNERFSDEISWLPVVRGARFGERLKPFKPHPEGFTGTFDYKLGTEVTMIAAGNSWALYSGKMPPEDFARDLDVLYERTGLQEFRLGLDQSARNLRNMDRIMASLLVGQCYAPSEDSGYQRARIEQILQSEEWSGFQLATYEAGYRNLVSGTGYTP